MRKEIIEIEAKIGEAVDDIKKLYEEVRKTVVAGEEAGEKVSKGVDEIGKSSKTTAKGVKGIATSIKGIGTAMKAAGIGLIIVLFSQLKEIFTANQKVADSLAAVTETISLVFNQFANTIVDVYEAVSKSTGGFDALGKVLKGILTISVTPLKLAFYGIKLGVQEAQLAWEKSFFGDKDQNTIDQLNSDILETKLALVDVGEKAIEAGKNVASNIVEAIGEVSEFTSAAINEVSKINIKGAYESAKAIVQLKNNAKLAAAEQGLLVEKYDILAEKQRQIRDEERNSIDDRIKANNELKDVLDKQEKAMLTQASLQVAAAQADVNKNNSIENQVALTESLANQQGVLAQIEGFRSEQKMNDLALDKEKIELNKSLGESESKLSIERKRFNAEQIEDELLRLERLKEIDLLEQEQESVRLQALIDNLAAGTQAKVDAQIVLDEFTEQSRQTNLTRDKETAEAKIKISELESKAKSDSLNSYAQALGAIGDLIGKETAAGKVASVASTLISTYLSAQQAYASQLTIPTPDAPIRAALAAGVAVASGLANVKAILAVKTPGGGGGASSAGSAPRAQSPSFNIVGKSSTNQLAESIGSQEKKPIKTYVVSKEMSNTQELDRNTENLATFG